jgi:hypothetical protein
MAKKKHHAKKHSRSHKRAAHRRAARHSKHKVRHTTHVSRHVRHHARRVKHHVSRHVKSVKHHAARHARHISHHVKHARRAVDNQFDDQQPGFDAGQSFSDFAGTVGKSLKSVEKEVEHNVVAASVVMVVLGLVYFVVNLWVVNFGSSLFGVAVESNWQVFSAALLTVAELVGGSIAKKMF